MTLTARKKIIKMPKNSRESEGNEIPFVFFHLGSWQSKLLFLNLSLAFPLMPT